MKGGLYGCLRDMELRQDYITTELALLGDMDDLVKQSRALAVEFNRRKQKYR